jgi:hypothetical protein
MREGREVGAQAAATDGDPVGVPTSPAVGVPTCCWCFHLAMDVGEGQKQTRSIDSPVRRRGGVENSENGAVFCMDINKPLLHIETDRSDPPLHSRCPPLAFPPRHGCERRPEAN